MVKCCVLNVSGLARPMIGGSIRTGLFLKALVGLYDQVELVGATGVESSTWAEDFPGVTYHRLCDRSLNELFQDRRKNNPFHLRFTPEEVDRWRQYLAQNRPDVILTEGIWFRDLVEAGREVHDATFMANMHNIESELFRRFYRLLLRRPLSLINPRVIREYLLGYANIRENEDYHFRQSRVIFVCSEREAKILKRRVRDKEIHAVANTYYRNNPPAKAWTSSAANQSVVFVGELEYGPNRAAIKQIIRKIAPILGEKSPKLGIHIAGRSSDDSISKLAVGSPNVKVTENIPDTDTLYENALCLIVPLRVGAGTRIKILEAMYRGVPVISTHVGAEGLGLTDEQNVLYAHSTREFIAAIQRLEEDHRLGARIGAAGRELYLERYSPEQIISEIRTIIGRAAADVPSSAPPGVARGDLHLTSAQSR